MAPGKPYLLAALAAGHHKMFPGFWLVPQYSVRKSVFSQHKGASEKLSGSESHSVSAIDPGMTRTFSGSSITGKTPPPSWNVEPASPGGFHLVWTMPGASESMM